MKTRKSLEREIRELGREFEEREPLLNLTYDHLAGGGRDHAQRIRAKKVDPETAEMIRRIWS